MKNLPLYKVRDVNNIKQLVEDSCELFKDNIAYIVKNSDKEYTKIPYSQVLEEMNALGTAFINLGLKDKRIAIIGENRYEWAISYLATINGTGIVVPLDKQLPINEIVSCIKRAKVEAIVYSKKLEEKVAQISKENDMLSYYIGMDLEEDDGKFLSLNKLINKGKELVKNGDKSFIEAKIDNEAMAELLFTSGTTSQSKAVMLSHKNLSYNIHQHTQMINICPGDVFLSMLPIHHVYECVVRFLNANI